MTCPYSQSQSSGAAAQPLGTSLEIGKPGGAKMGGSKMRGKPGGAGPKNEEDICDYAKNLLLEALDGHNPQAINSIAQQLKECAKCTGILDFQLKIREAMVSRLSNSAPPQLRIEISKNLKRMDLGKLDITDFPPPKRR